NLRAKLATNSSRTRFAATLSSSASLEARWERKELMSTELHVIFGTGPVACWTARTLRRQGYAVRAVNRSGMRPNLMPIDVELAKADILDPAQAATAATGA